MIYISYVDASGLKLKDKVEKTKIVEPCATKSRDAINGKSFMANFERVFDGKLGEQDIQYVREFFGFDSFTGEFSLIPIEGSNYAIDFSKTSYGKDELSHIEIDYWVLLRDDAGKMVIKTKERPFYGTTVQDPVRDEYWFGHGRYEYLGEGYEGETEFLTNPELGTDIEDCEFYILPMDKAMDKTMDKTNEETVLISISLYTLDQRSSTFLMAYNDEKTIELCNFTELREPIIEGWKKDNTGWWYQNEDGTYPANSWKCIENKWYAFDENGYMREGWYKEDGKYYYLVPGSGYMATGWINDGGTWYYMNPSGAMQTGWVNDGGTWYYMNPSGEMATGWINDGGTWYYMNPNGSMAIGWVNDGGTWYYMNASGKMVTGWVNDGGTWYYMNSSGEMATGWVNDGGTWYYMNPSGSMATGWIEVGGKMYFLNTNGAWVA